MLNRDNSSHTVTLSGLNGIPYQLPDGTVLVDALSLATYTISSGQISTLVSTNWGIVLLEQDQIDQPSAPVAALAASSPDVMEGITQNHIRKTRVSGYGFAGRILQFLFQEYRCKVLSSFTLEVYIVFRSQELDKYSPGGGGITTQKNRVWIRGCR